MSLLSPVLEQIHLLGIVPVIAIDRAEDAVPLARALVEGGLPCAEVTFRTTAAEASIKAIAKAFPDMTLGAGTVLTTEHVDKATGAGAKYIVSPGLNPSVVEYCMKKNIPITPGVATPSDVERAIGLGLQVVKFFPAEQAGGAKYVKALGGPYKEISFIPTGGVDENNLLSYLKLSNVFGCGGSWMVKQELIAAQKFDEIRALTSAAIVKMLGFELRHVGMNAPDAERAMAGAKLIADITGMAVKEGNSSIFVGTQFEFLKRMYLGEHGHLAVGTNFIHRAAAYLERKGYKMRADEKSEKDGKLVAIYFEAEVGGFALHLLQV